jgi:hypothetical protein
MKNIPNLTIFNENCILNHANILNKELVFHKNDKIQLEQHVKRGLYRTTTNEY